MKHIEKGKIIIYEAYLKKKKKHLKHIWKKNKEIIKRI